MCSKEIWILVLVSVICLYSPSRSEDKLILRQRYEEAYSIASNMSHDFLTIFEACLESTMSSQQFSLDNLQSYINYPSKTTVGFAPRFTANRKFFANMITTKAFKNMLANDEEEIRKNMVKKMKFCDGAVLDLEMLRDFYDKEVDQTKL